MGAAPEFQPRVAERRLEERYPCVGIALVHSAALGGDVAGLGRMLHHAALKDMSLRGLVFDVDTALEPGRTLVVLVAQPDGGAHERLISVVRRCTKTRDGMYRVGVRIEAIAAVGGGDPDEQVCFPVAADPAMPVEADLLCPACGRQATFRLAGQQDAGKGAAAMPLYDCGACGTTRTITSMLAHSRRRPAHAAGSATTPISATISRPQEQS